MRYVLDILKTIFWEDWFRNKKEMEKTIAIVLQSTAGDLPNSSYDHTVPVNMQMIIISSLIFCLCILYFRQMVGEREGENQREK